MALYLMVYEQEQLIKTQLIDSERLEIGRAEGAEVQFSSPEISRNHARLIIKSDALVDMSMNEEIADLIDAGSRYGVWVNDEQVWYHALSVDEPFRISEHLSLCLSRQVGLDSVVLKDNNNATNVQTELSASSLEQETTQFKVITDADLIKLSSVNHSESTVQSSINTEHAEVTEAEHAEVTEAEHAEVTETGHAEVTETEHAEVTETEHAEVIETEHAEVIETEHAVVTETEHVEVTEAEHIEVTEAKHAEAVESFEFEEVEQTEVIESVNPSDTELLGSSEAESHESSQTPVVVQLETESVEQVEEASDPSLDIDTEPLLSLNLSIVEGEGKSKEQVFRPVLWDQYENHLSSIYDTLTQVQQALPIGTDGHTKLNHSLNEIKTLQVLLSPSLIPFDEALVRARQAVAPLTPADFALHLNNQCGELMVSQSFIEAFKIAFFALVNADEVDWLHIDLYYRDGQLVLKSDPPLSQYLDPSLSIHQVALTILGLA